METAAQRAQRILTEDAYQLARNHQHSALAVNAMQLNCQPNNLNNLQKFMRSAQALACTFEKYGKFDQHIIFSQWLLLFIIEKTDSNQDSIIIKEYKQALDAIKTYEKNIEAALFNQSVSMQG